VGTAAQLLEAHVFETWLLAITGRVAVAPGIGWVSFTHDQTEAFALADEIGILNAGRLEQLGTPEEIYHQPASPFVARFTGIAGQLVGRAIGRRAGFLLVRIGAQQIAVRDVGAIRDGDWVSVLVRPAATSLTVAWPDAAVGTLPGTVLDTAYRGRGYDHVIDYGHGTLTSVFDASAWTRGSTCNVKLAPEGCTAFPVTAHAVEAAAPTPSPEPEPTHVPVRSTAVGPPTAQPPLLRRSRT
jgi:iron(III) transport system ATP-binding protein